MRKLIIAAGLALAVLAGTRPALAAHPTMKKMVRETTALGRLAGPEDNGPKIVSLDSRDWLDQRAAHRSNRRRACLARNEFEIHFPS